MFSEDCGVYTSENLDKEIIELKRLIRIVTDENTQLRLQVSRLSEENKKLKEEKGSK